MHLEQERRKTQKTKKIITIKEVFIIDMDKIAKSLEKIVGSHNVKVKAPMSQHTSFRAGGNAAVLVQPQTADELQEVIRMLNEEGIKHMVIGNGTNILVRDEGYDGVIVKAGAPFSYVNIEGTKLSCGCGTLLSVVANAAADKSLTGFEFASGIPGSIGGAVFMNAGAYDGEIKNILEEVKLISADGSRVYTVSGEELHLGYRRSDLQESGDIVIEATIALEEGEEEAIRGKMAELTARRNSKQPVQYPSAGSFFKRPEGYFAGKLVQDAGCKGLTVGGAQVSVLHSGFVINIGGATATDIIQLMQLVQERVMDKFGVMLEPEVRII